MKPRIDPDKLWFVVRTAIKAEAKAADNLRLAGFDCYFPRRRVERYNKRHHTYRTSEHPLMLRYIFLGMPRLATERHFGFARACEGVESILGSGGQYVPVEASLLQDILLAEIDMQFDETRAAKKHREGAVDRAFPAGADVIVRKLESALDGMVGTVEKTNGDDMVRITIGSLKAWVHRDDIKAA